MKNDDEIAYVHAANVWDAAMGGLTRLQFLSDDGRLNFQQGWPSRQDLEDALAHAVTRAVTCDWCLGTGEIDIVHPDGREDSEICPACEGRKHYPICARPTPSGICGRYENEGGVHGTRPGGHEFIPAAAIPLPNVAQKGAQFRSAPVPQKPDPEARRLEQLRPRTRNELADKILYLVREGQEDATLDTAMDDLDDFGMQLTLVFLFRSLPDPNTGEPPLPHDYGPDDAEYNQLETLNDLVDFLAHRINLSDT